MKKVFNSIEEVYHLREIQALKKLQPHENIVKLLEVLYDEPTGRLALVFELMEKNLYELISTRKTPLNYQKLKYYIFQVLKAIEHMHRNGIFHRDIKPENILLKGDKVKLADFGSCRGIFTSHPYTEYISTRWYRPPECLMTDGYYDSKMDLWGVGCVFFEILTLYPLFPGKDELDQIHKIHAILGTPSENLLAKFQKLFLFFQFKQKRHATHMQLNFMPQKGKNLANLMPNVPFEFIDLIQKLLIYNPDERITASEALKHSLFRDFYEVDELNGSNSGNRSMHHPQFSLYKFLILQKEIYHIHEIINNNKKEQLFCFFYIFEFYLDLFTSFIRYLN